MQLTRESMELYRTQAPELLESVTSGEAEFVMKRDPKTDYCVKFDKGWCGIHRDYGPEFLGDACNFFPRITRAVGDTIITTAALSCPETARMMLYTEGAFNFAPRAEMRTPYMMRNILPRELSVQDALDIHAAFIEAAGDVQYSAGMNLMRISTAARGIEMQPMAQWKSATDFYLRMAQGRIPAAQAEPSDMFNLLHALHGLVKASQSVSTRLRTLLEHLADTLGVTFLEGGRMKLAADAPSRVVKMLSLGRAQEQFLQPIMRRYLQAQLSESLFPFAGLGNNWAERITIIGVRFATLRMALMTLGAAPKEAEVIAIVQTLARFMDHLADPEMSMQIYSETGWVREPRLRAILGE